jgi:tetratricopeptide (TPR) repeat protein
MGDIGFCRRIGMLACVLALLSTHAYAQPQPGSAAGRPWAEGVSEREQATAFELYVAGNVEFAQARFAQALAKYKEAIGHWDHPEVRFNMAVCLIKLDQPLEAKDNLERSLKYGARALSGDDRYQQGLTYRKLLDARLASIEISCREPGMQVTLDGKFLLAGPAIMEKIVLPGEHQLVAMEVGFLTATRSLVLVAGERTTYEVSPLERKTAPRMIRRWEAWRPWAVMAGGSVLLGLGVASYVAATNNFARYDSENLANCLQGCYATLSGDAGYLREQGGTERVLAYSLISAGGAVLVGSVIGVIVNEPRLQLEPSHVQPVVAPISGGALFSMRLEL